MLALRPIPTWEFVRANQRRAAAWADGDRQYLAAGQTGAALNAQAQAAFFAAMARADYEYLVDRASRGPHVLDEALARWFADGTYAP